MARTSKKNKEAPTAKKSAAKGKAKTTGPVIYVGPPIKGTLIHSTFTIFADGVPQEYQDHPSLKHLFVQPERLDQARKEIGRTGSLRNIYYWRAVEEFSKKGGK